MLVFPTGQARGPKARGRGVRNHMSMPSPALWQTLPGCVHDRSPVGLQPAGLTRGESRDPSIRRSCCRYMDPAFAGEGAILSVATNRLVSRWNPPDGRPAGVPGGGRNLHAELSRDENRDEPIRDPCTVRKEGETMNQTATLFVSTFTTLLAIINPLDSLPVFLRLGKDERAHRRAARRASTYATLPTIFFLIFGTLLLEISRCRSAWSGLSAASS